LLVEDGINSKNPEHLFYALYFLKTYNSENNEAALFNIDEKTLRKYKWMFVEAISLLKYKVIDFDKRYCGANENSSCFITVDGIDCRIIEPQPFIKKISKQWYSHKFNGPAVKYEVGVSIARGDIVWINGPYPGSANDAAIARDGLVQVLDKYERFEADEGYISLDPQYCRAKNGVYSILNEGTKEHHRMMVLRARHETLNARLKNFSCLHDQFRHNLIKHSDCFYAVAVITQVNIDN